MASIKLTGDTSGVITVSAPASAGTNTVTMPAATGTVALTANITTAVPSQSGNSGKYLTTNGSATSWGAVASGGMTQLASFATTSGTTVVSPTISLTGYKMMVLVLDTIEADADTNGAINLTPNGGTIVDFAGGMGPTNVMYGQWFIDLASGLGNGAVNIIATSSSTGVIAAQTSSRCFLNTGITTSTTSIAFTMNGSVAFNGGSITIYGLK